MTYGRMMAATAVVALTATGAMATPVTVTNVAGAWQNVLPAVGVNALTGEGTNEIRWGAPSPASTDPNDKSGYRFDGVTPPNVLLSPGTTFDIGTFTHFNNPIFGPSIQSADLAVTVDFMIDGGQTVQFTPVFTFLHWESPNPDDPCGATPDSWPVNPNTPNPEDANTGINSAGCADAIALFNNPDLTQSVRVGQELFTFNLTGFDNNGSVLWTAENATTPVSLQASYTVAPIPLPAAAWLMLFGLGGLAALRRFRTAA